MSASQPLVPAIALGVLWTYTQHNRATAFRFVGASFNWLMKGPCYRPDRRGAVEFPRHSILVAASKRYFLLCARALSAE
jgi:hypothetical protein